MEAHGNDESERIHIMTARKNTQPAESTEIEGQTGIDVPAPEANKRESVPEVPFAALEIGDDAFVERKSTSAGRPRSPYMLALGELLRNHFKTGKPAALECDADEKTVAALEKKISSAAQYEKLGLRFGAYVKSKNDGKVYVTFKVVEPTKRPRKNKTEES